MSILFRSVARQYLVNIATLFLIVASLIVAVDVVINLDRFAGRARAISEESGAAAGAARHAMLTALLVVDLWGPRLVQLFTYLNGMVLIAAMGFTCAHLVRTREFTAMLASGISLHRAGLPFLVVGALLLGAQAAVHEAVLPRLGHLLPRDAGDAGRRTLATFPLRLTPDDAGRLWYARSFDDRGPTLEDLAVWERDAQARIRRTIVAPRATWDGAGWALQGGLATAALDEGAASDAGAARPEPVARLDGGLDPRQIKVRALQGYAGTLSWGEIGALIRAGAEPRILESLDRARWSRVAGLVASFLALWGALAVFLVRSPRPMVTAAVKAAPIAAGGFAASALAAGASIPGLPVWFGAFLPCLVLLSVAIAMASGVET